MFAVLVVGELHTGNCSRGQGNYINPIPVRAEEACLLSGTRLLVLRAFPTAEDALPSTQGEHSDLCSPKLKLSRPHVPYATMLLISAHFVYSSILRES